MSTVISPAETRQYRCPLCPKVFHNLLGLTGHTVSHTKEKPFKCEQCNFEDSRKCNLDCHKRRYHLTPEEFQASKKFKCEICGFATLSNASLKLHERKHTGEKPFTCTACDFRTASPYTLKLHKRTHTDERPYACSFSGCKYCARSVNRLKEHLLVHNKDSQIKCPYPECNFRGKHQRYLKQHLVTHGEPRYACSSPGCDYKGRHRIHLRVHLTSHKDERPHACTFPGCTYRAKLPATLIRHEKIHQKEKPYTCSKCDCRFKRKYDLTLHERSHVQEPFRCSSADCAYKTWDKGNMKTHEQTHKPRTIACTTSGCLFKTKTKAALRDHIKNHKDPNYAQCSMPGCNFRSKFQSNLKRHMKVHEATQRKYACTFCPCYYEKKCELEAHLWSHNGEKPYECSLCQFRSSRMEGIMGHMKRRHGRGYLTIDFVGHRLKKSKQLPRTRRKLENQSTALRDRQLLPKFSIDFSYGCPICPQFYSDEEELEDHVRGHYGGEPFECQYCQFQCASTERIIEHVRQRHGKVFSFSGIVPRIEESTGHDD